MRIALNDDPFTLANESLQCAARWLTASSCASRSTTILSRSATSTSSAAAAY
jgi:hypothetical protein